MEVNMPGTAKQEIESFEQAETTKLDSEVKTLNDSQTLLVAAKADVTRWSGDAGKVLSEYKKAYNDLDKRRKGIGQYLDVKLKVLQDEVGDVKTVQDRINDFNRELS